MAKKFLGDIAFVMIGIILIIIVIPILIGFGIAILLEPTGDLYYATVLLVPIFSWIVMGALYYIK